MAPPLRSPTDAHHNPLKSASGARHPHHRARFPSLTDFPDSPSVYSPYAYHSPEDFDDETASTIRSLSTEGVQDDSDIDDCTDDASHRISLRGPKIRFHSRAPWETEDAIHESDKNAKSGTIGNKLKGKASRADNLIRTFTRGSLTSRPSIESARSQVSVSSFEVTAGDSSSSRGALYDLTRQSMSTSSFASSATSASVHVQNFVHTTDHPRSPHHLPQSHDPLSRATVSLDGMVSPAIALESVPIRHSSSETSRVGYERSAKPSLVPLSEERQARDQFVHPYANPDLVSYLPETIPSHHPISGDMAGSDSNSTVTDSTSTRSASSFSVIPTEISTTSLTCRDVPHGSRRVNGKEISSPISVVRQSDAGYVDRSTRFLSLHPPPVGFEAPRRNTPTVLITLQEAQERERFRGNTVHTTVARQKPPYSNSDDISEATEEQTAEVDTGGKMTHTRARSTSAGTRHKTVQLASAQPQDAEMGDGSTVSTPVSAISGRSLKHKKSGFMRLFGGRNSEGEKGRSSTPPIPPVIDVCAEESSQVHGSVKTSKLTLQTVPISPLASTHSSSSGGKGPSPRRRQPPPLSIVTKTSDHSIPTSVSGKKSPMGLNFAPLFLTVPQSAPPGNSDFPGLKLRPVSTSFSSHFADMVTGAAERQRDVHTPSSAASSNTALSPFTPVSMRRSDDASSTAAEALGEEHLTIQGLQDQLASAKKAWQQQIWELRGHIRDLTSELEDLRAADNREYCEVCSRGEPRKRYASPLDEQQSKKVGIVNRPRAPTGDAARFASGN
ncbi:hypothetical protein L210DRAFT_928445 [Boletus edulis BED1]|uniref:Uncharacterized protein n=1 Tax=Boletus edulis BED1 TaxID=1328754 RepID=A0AAD4GHR0_BOLED|nr:hypothetical protein L210DRAFT_928445 [Boletus edulis BED1]